MFLLVPRKGQAGNVSGISCRVCKRSETIMFFLGHSATNAHGFVDRVSMTFRR